MIQKTTRPRPGRIYAWLILFQLFAGAPFALSGELKRDLRGPGTIRMAERLQRIAEQVNPMNNLFLSTDRAKLLQSVVAKTSDASRRNELTLAAELLNAGRNREALHEFEELEQTLAASRPRELALNATAWPGTEGSLELTEGRATVVARGAISARMEWNTLVRSPTPIRIEVTVSGASRSLRLDVRPEPPGTRP